MNAHRLFEIYNIKNLIDENDLTWISKTERFVIILFGNHNGETLAKNNHNISFYLFDKRKKNYLENDKRR